MINMLLWVEIPQTMIDVMESVDGEGNKIYPYPYSSVSEMKDGWLLILDDKDQFDALEQALEAEGDIIIVGTYNRDGSQYEWFSKPNRNHSLAKYQERLNDVIEDEVPRRPTEAEALDTQVNKIFGWGNRILGDIV